MRLEALVDPLLLSVASDMHDSERDYYREPVRLKRHESTHLGRFVEEYKTTSLYRTPKGSHGPETSSTQSKSDEASPL